MRTYIIKLIDADIGLTEKRNGHLINWLKESGNTDEYFPRSIKADKNRIEFANKIKDILITLKT